MATFKPTIFLLISRLSETIQSYVILTSLALFSSVVTASIASFILGLVMVLVILLSRHFNVNPDNVATPIAASLGDSDD